ncbi:class I SAM-dependent methyltransferase [Endozoicomonas euniceicola]|uniref:Class I SAM-dependent methyltransferase n=1 Tax=Endozoicomonas euniceicola TaxID=1234143 RepID=A0ABY6GW95_9GAMM|nr:class I SAM-dependent methyltransferase [Endozoicomonas euniceicola]UYM16351.1 class I SAM-dependent methyltransferase [Endozoicomonas euniceicola]
MTETIKFYNQNAQEFFDSTVEVDASGLHSRFLNHLPDRATILDAGCGSGRDTKAFLDLGYQVHAFDASRELVNKAASFTGLPVAQATFQSYRSNLLFDGVWACASLLHLPLHELAPAFANLSSCLKDSGIFYCSFKLGEGEQLRNGRHFTNLNQDALTDLLLNTPLTIKETWETADLRPGREDEYWLNALLVKA